MCSIYLAQSSLPWEPSLAISSDFFSPKGTINPWLSQSITVGSNFLITLCNISADECVPKVASYHHSQSCSGFPVWGLTQWSKQNGSPETLGLGFNLCQRVSGFPCSTPHIKAVLCVKELPVVWWTRPLLTNVLTPVFGFLPLGCLFPYVWGGKEWGADRGGLPAKSDLTTLDAPVLLGFL